MLAVVGLGVLVALGLLITLAVPPARAQRFSGPKLSVSWKASTQQIHPGGSFSLDVLLDLPPGLHVNSHRPSEGSLIPTEVQVLAAPGLAVGEVEYPEGHDVKFPFTPKPISVYEGKVAFRVPVSAAKDAKPGTVTIKGSLRAQPCDDHTCFPPQVVEFSAPVAITAAGVPGSLTQPDPRTVGVMPGDSPRPEAASDTPPPANAGAEYPRLTGFVPPAELITRLDRGLAGEADSGSRLGDLLLGGNWLLALPLIFLAGLALNLTPCVYPLIPITVGFFGGQSGGTKGRVMGLAGFYVLGMATMYSSLGVAAALTGQLFGSQLQSPYVLIGFAAVMAALGLSMFGLWEMRLPAGLTSRVSARGGFAGALAMGMLVGLVAAPCIGPAVVALLQVVGQMGKPVEGFAIFFALATGLGTPYLVLGYYSGLIRKLPRSGEWMNGVKHVFGLVMFGMALYYLGPLVGDKAYRAAIGLYALGAGLYLLFVDASGRAARRFYFAKRGIGAAAMAVAVWLLLPSGQTRRGIPFEPYSDARVWQARAEGRAVLIDFRADWCAACKELEARTFSDPGVVAATSDVVALKKDLTRWDDPEAQRLRRQYGIVGLPNVVLIPPGETDRFSARGVGNGTRGGDTHVRR